MTIGAFSLVIIAAFIHATWNLLSKRASSVGPVFVFAYNLFASLAYLPWVVYLMVEESVQWNWTVAGFIVLSGLIHLGYSLCLQRGYQNADFSVVYPVARGTGPMLSTLGAVLFLAESPSLQVMTGLVTVVSGIWLIATQGSLRAFRQPGGLAGVRWGTATGGLIATYTVVDAYSVKTLGIAPVVLDWFSNLLRFVLLAPLIIANPGRARELMKGYWLLAAAVGLLSPLSYILVLTALNTGAPLSVVAPMREMSMMLGAIMGMVILGENVGPWRIVGCAVLIFGVVMLTLS
ncbi:EamA family transporter [uncultured Bradyrhizobium sp.]|uniref:EamA family transporter n=1 Tax=uncultured Bradyrhizobium sp. TaxID=199684 RepID=UPI0035CB0BCD